MSKYRLGEFEEVVLLTVAILLRRSLRNRHPERNGRQTETGSQHRVLANGTRPVGKERLLKFGIRRIYGRSVEGKRKRYYRVTKYGQRALQETKEQRQQLWDAIP